MNVSYTGPAISSDQLQQWDRFHVWHAFTQMQEYDPIIIDRGQGEWLYDIDGNAFIDGVASLWCAVHGHNHPHINEAIRDQLDRVAHVTNLGGSNPTTIRLARRLAEIAPGNLNHVFFSSDGASAVEAALKMAFQYWQQKPDPEPQRKKYLALDSAYHGDTIGSVSLGGIQQFHALFGPLLFDVLRLPCPDVYHAADSITEEDAKTFFANQYREIFEQHHREVAALVIEPICQGAAGIITHPPGLLRELRNLCDEYQILMIVDEVAVGMGRSGTMFACEHEQVAPDIMCLGKGLGGGYLPIAATLATTEVWNAFLGRHDESKTLFHGHTFGGNPLACAAANACLEIFETDQTLARAQPKIDRMQEHLRRIAGLEFVGDTRGRGMMAGIELVSNQSEKTPFPWQEHRGANICRRCREHQVLLRPLGDVVVVMPPLNIADENIDRIFAAIESSIRAEFSQHPAESVMP